MKSFFAFIRYLFVAFVGALLVGLGVYYYQVQRDTQLVDSPIVTDSPDFKADNGAFNIPSEAVFLEDVYLANLKNTDEDQVLSVNSEGKLILVDKNSQQIINNINYLDNLSNSTVVYDLPNIFSLVNNLLGIDETNPQAKMHINTQHSETVGLIVQAEQDQTANLFELRNSSGNIMSRINQLGGLVLDNNAGHQIEIRPSGNTGHLSSSGGAIFIENTHNLGTGIGIYSNAGIDALGNMINVKVDNPAYSQAAFYMDYDGLSNAVEIRSNTNDESSNALSITNFNTLDSAVGVIGYETGRGTVKITHNGTGSDANASGLSIDLQGTGTKSQGIYVDSTASGGTTGKLLRLRNETVDRFVVDYQGSVSIGGNGYDTSVTKYGNTVGDEFFVGTNGAFRIQRSATDSEAFRTQIVGDTQGRWLGTSDGKLKFGDGSSSQDVVLQRTGVGLFQVDSDIQIVSQSTNNDVMVLTASDGSRLGRFTETSGGHGWFEVDNATGTAQVLFRADGGDSYVLSGNFGIGTTSFDATADKVLTFGNGTAPAASIADGVQLWAEDVAASSELRVRDELGNVSTLSPHNFSLIPDGASEDLAWSYYGEKAEYAINADITKALRILEDLSGEKLIYKVNTITGKEVDEKLSSQVESALQEEQKLEEKYAGHINIIDNVINMLSQVVFEAKVVFKDTVEYLADVTFKGNITVNADTGGSELIPSGTSKFAINFEKQFSQKPIVYVNFSENIDYKISNISEAGFEIDIYDIKGYDIEMTWLALISETNDFTRLKIIAPE